MKKIGLLSDTHSFLDEQIFHYFKTVDEIWHAGDIGDISVTDTLKSFKPIRGVYGNIDDYIVRRTFPEHLQFELEGFKIWITHIGSYSKNYNYKLKQKIYKDPPDIFICGHSHILKIFYYKHINCLHLNPGAAGNHGIHKVRTLLRFSLHEKSIKNMEIIELGDKNFNLPNYTEKIKI